LLLTHRKAVGAIYWIPLRKVRALEDLLYQYKVGSQLGAVDPSALSQLSGFVRFPENEESIAVNRKAVEQFGDTVMRAFRHKNWERDIELRIQHFSKSDVDILQNAFAFSSSCGALFDLINGSTGRGHKAKVYLCDLQSGQLKVAMDICQVHGWTSANFKRSNNPPLWYFNFNNH
jgi:hypothetical protein